LEYTCAVKPAKKIAFVIAIGLGAIAGSLYLSGAAQYLSDAAQSPKASTQTYASWAEFKWPFVLDQWGVGRAFVCKPADCGSEVVVYLRPKFGFCNCTTGVLDDEELDRVGDKELMTTEAVAFGPGRTIEIAWMTGRSRAFRKTNTSTDLLSIAFHDNCDLMVAVATYAAGSADTIEPAVMAFLRSERVLRWVKWLTS
jgi:hypothetical protein